MKKYFSYFISSWKSCTAYKVDYFLNFLFSLVFFFISFALWKTIYGSEGFQGIGGYSLVSTITYYFVTNIIFRLDLGMSVWLNNDIWSGYLTNDLVRPWNVKIVENMFAFANLFVGFVIYIPFLVVIYFAAHQYIILPTSTDLIYFVVTLIIGLIFSGLFAFTLHSLAFYFGDQEANIELSNYLVMILAGGMFPLIFLPEKIAIIFQALPFKILFDVPASIWLGKMSWPEILHSWLEAGLWIVAMYIIFTFLYKNGLKRYTGTGR